MSRADEIVARLIQLLEIIGDLADDFVFVGGSIVPLLITDPAAPEARMTKDIDVIVSVATNSKLGVIESKLRDLGFGPDLSDDKPVICRHVKDTLVLDVMPTNPEILGFSSSWYEQALEYPIIKEIASGKNIKIINAPLFICTKFEAYANRGKNDNQDLQNSVVKDDKDLEDIVALVNSRAGLQDEILSHSKEVCDYISAATIDVLKSDPKIEWMIAEEDRVPLVQERLANLCKAPLLRVMQLEPTLSELGFGANHLRNATRDQRAEEIAKMRIELLKDFDIFQKVSQWIESNTITRKTINNEYSSYSWKHVAENKIGTYVPNGVFIAAAINVGLKYRREPPNAYFNLRTFQDMHEYS